MAREWTRKSIEEIMKGVIAREGGGGTVNWITELAKELQNPVYDPTTLPTNGNYVGYMATVKMPSGASSGNYPISGNHEGIYLGNYTGYDEGHAVAEFDNAWLVLTGAYASSNSLPVGSEINLYFGMGNNGRPTLVPFSRVLSGVMSPLAYSAVSLTAIDSDLQISARYDVANPLFPFDGQTITIGGSNYYVFGSDNLCPTLHIEVTHAPTIIPNTGAFVFDLTN